MSTAEPSPRVCPQQPTHVLLRPLAACPARLKIFLKNDARQTGGVDNEAVLPSSVSVVLYLSAMLSAALTMLQSLEHQSLVVFYSARKAVLTKQELGNNVRTSPVLMYI